MAPPATPLSASDAQRRFGRRVVALVTIGFVAVLVAAAAAALVVVRAQENSYWVAHTYRVESALYGMSRGVVGIRADGLMAASTGRPRAPSYRQYHDETFRELDRVASLTADNPAQQARLRYIRPVYERIAATLDTGSNATLAARLIAVEPLRLRALALVTDMLHEEQRLLRGRIDAQDRGVRLFWIVLPLATLLLVLVGVTSVLAIRRFTGDLARSKDELAELNEGLEDAVQDRTRDLQRANDEIQRFAYIVSHDLRSPLVNVMGFTAELDAARKALEQLVERVEAEAPALLTQDAKLAAREDLPEAIGFIRSSTQRMDRLINAILRLSREGRRALAPERLDATAIAQAAVDSLRHRADEQGVDIAVEGRLPEIACDRVAFEQIVNNLVENAVKYLKPGRPGRVRIRGRAVRGRAIIDVEDNGRGIEPRDHERIFDLFRRSGMQDQPGEGIGLAHVRALAHRLGGTVDVRSELDHGATFTLTLPVEFAGDKDRPTP